MLVLFWGIKVGDRKKKIKSIMALDGCQTTRNTQQSTKNMDKMEKDGAG
jgi:hypothetical protein